MEGKKRQKGRQRKERSKETRKGEKIRSKAGSREGGLWWWDGVKLGER
jgi:hypothetical protein